MDTRSRFRTVVHSILPAQPGLRAVFRFARDKLGGGVGDEGTLTTPVVCYAVTDVTESLVDTKGISHEVTKHRMVEPVIVVDPRMLDIQGDESQPLEMGGLMPMSQFVMPGTGEGNSPIYWTGMQIGTNEFGSATNEEELEAAELEEMKKSNPGLAALLTRGAAT